MGTAREGVVDWKLLLIGTVMAALGGLLAWRFRGSKFGSQPGPGCAMATALLLLLTGMMALFVGFLFRV
jgi:hypothetical protein